MWGLFIVSIVSKVVNKCISTEEVPCNVKDLFPETIAKISGMYFLFVLLERKL